MFRKSILSTKGKVFLLFPFVLLSCQKQDMPLSTKTGAEIVFGASTIPCVVETRCVAAPDPTAVYEACETAEGNFVAMVESSFSSMDAPGTRADNTDATLDANGFGVSCYHGSSFQWWSAFTAISSTDPDYDPMTKKFKASRCWPATEPSSAISFYAWNYTTNGPLSGSLSSSTTYWFDGTTDIILAKASPASYRQTNHLEFQHVMGKLGTVTLEAEDGMIISNVSMSVNGKIGSSFNWNTMQWTNNSQSDKYQVFNNVSTSTAGSKDNELYFVPGEQEFTVTYDYSMFGETFTGIVATGKFTIVAGEVTSLRIRFTGEAEPFTLEAAEDGYILLSNRQIYYNTPIYQLSVNNGAWTTLGLWQSMGYYPVQLSAGDRLRIKSSYDFGLQISSTMKFYAYGNIASLFISRSEAKRIGFVNSDYNDLGYMFRDCNLLYSHPDKDIVFPKWDYGYYSCHNMFENCVNLERAPKIQARSIIGSRTFEYMFSGCSGLKSAPGVFIDTIDMSGSVSDRTYTFIFSDMFWGCTSLESIDEIRIDEFIGTGRRYFSFMFYGCTSLEESPFLNFETVPEYGMESMFYGCTNLRSVKAALTDISATGCLNGWLSGVSSTGTFYKNPSATYENSALGLPSGWTVTTY